jgi:hypothetical protein
MKPPGTCLAPSAKRWKAAPTSGPPWCARPSTRVLGGQDRANVAAWLRAAVKHQDQQSSGPS